LRGLGSDVHPDVQPAREDRAHAADTRVRRGARPGAFRTRDPRRGGRDAPRVRHAGAHRLSCVRAQGRLTMVVPSLTLGGLVGVALSGGFVYWEVGRYSTPQVPQTLFDERKEVTGYTVGLFVGVPLAVAYILFVDSMANGALPGAL